MIPPYYDSLIAKLIVRGKDRNEAISRMSRALEMFIVEGVYTTIPLHRGFWPIRTFAPGILIPDLLSGFWRRMGKRIGGVNPFLGFIPSWTRLLSYQRSLSDFAEKLVAGLHTAAIPQQERECARDA